MREPTCLKFLFEVERRVIINALAQTQSNQRLSAALGLLPTTLHERMKRLGLKSGSAPRDGISGPTVVDSHEHRTAAERRRPRRLAVMGVCLRGARRTINRTALRAIRPLLLTGGLLTTLGAFSALAAGDFPLKKLVPFTYVVDYEPFWSPDGRQIVLISSRHGGMKVHVMDAHSTSHGSDMRQLTTGDAEDDSPAWSPDGTRIAFVSVRDSVSHIFVMRADGSDVRQVTSGVGENIHPVWSPDGSRILFNTTHFVRQGAESPPPGSAAEARIIGDASDDGMDLAAICPDGTGLQRVTHHDGPRDPSFTYASFSPDGGSIVHRRLQGAISQIYVMNADGSGDHNVSGSSTVDGWPAWSPDGKRIVFARHTQDGFQIFVMNSDGSGVIQLTEALGGSAEGGFTNPRWSPDGTKILCSRRLGGITLTVFQAPR